MTVGLTHGTKDPALKHNAGYPKANDAASSGYCEVPECCALRVAGGGGFSSLCVVVVEEVCVVL